MLSKNYSTEKILLVVALFLFAGILFFNAFYKSDATVPAIVYINEGAEESDESRKSADSSDSQVLKSKVNINTATEEELADNLSGVGSTIARRIVEYRDYNGGFSSVEEIKNVSGIGDKMFEKIKDDICV